MGADDVPEPLDQPCPYCSCPHAEVLFQAHCPNPACRWYTADRRAQVIATAFWLSDIGEWWLLRDVD